MIDLIIVFFCCYQLHKQAFDKGIPAWPYVLRYLSGFFIIIFAIGMVIINVWGQDFMNNEDAQKQAVWLEPFAMMFEILLYIYLRSRIARVKVIYEEDEPTTPNDKQDLSYFR